MTTTPRGLIAYAPYGVGLMCALVYFERDADDRYNMPLGQVNVRAQRLNKLDKHHAVWLYRSHDFQADVLEYLQRFWPLDYRAA